VAGIGSFGISTHLFHGARLTQAHLMEIAAHEFDVVELRATRSHFDYHNATAVADLQQWLAHAGLELGSVHAPVTDSAVSGRPTVPLLLASADTEARMHALSEVERALHIARRIPFRTLIVHIGVPRGIRSQPADGNRDGARRSLEALQLMADRLGVRVAVEVIQNELSRAGSLVHFLEHVLEVAAVGICLDLGHAHLDGDLVEVTETVAEHLIAVEAHDNDGRKDDHLVPFDGTIDWPGVMTAVQKVGYEGTFMFELSARGPAKDTLARARKAREKLVRLLAS
jgi:sugar phosphate isomerase/epimerase